MNRTVVSLVLLLASSTTNALPRPYEQGKPVPVVVAKIVYHGENCSIAFKDQTQLDAFYIADSSKEGDTAWEIQNLCRKLHVGERGFLTYCTPIYPPEVRGIQKFSIHFSPEAAR